MNRNPRSLLQFLGWIALLTGLIVGFIKWLDQDFETAEHTYHQTYYPTCHAKGGVVYEFHFRANPTWICVRPHSVIPMPQGE